MDGFLDWVLDWLTEVASDWVGPLRGKKRARRAAKPSRVRSVTVPSVTGLPAYEARNVLATASLRMKLAAQNNEADKVRGVIVGQDPPAGHTVHRRTVICVRM